MCVLLWWILPDSTPTWLYRLTVLPVVYGVRMHPSARLQIRPMPLSASDGVSESFQIDTSALSLGAQLPSHGLSPHK